MLTNRLKAFVGGLLMALILGGWIHGSAVATFEGKTWKEALATVPCQNVTKEGKDLKISGTVIVDGNQFPSPTITKDDLMDPLEKRCFPRG